MKKSFGNFFILSAILFLTGCMGKYTEDPVKAYEYWANESPPKGVRAIHGKYTESAHWTKEYELYLELKATPFWINEFIRQNHLIKKDDSPGAPPNAPIWFKAANHSILYTQSDVKNISAYYHDTIGSKLFIYEIQL